MAWHPDFLLIGNYLTFLTIPFLKHAKGLFKQLSYDYIDKLILLVTWKDVWRRVEYILTKQTKAIMFTCWWLVSQKPYQVNHSLLFKKFKIVHVFTQPGANTRTRNVWEAHLKEYINKNTVKLTKCNDVSNHMRMDFTASQSARLMSKILCTNLLIVYACSCCIIYFHLERLSNSQLNARQAYIP